MAKDFMQIAFLILKKLSEGKRPVYMAQLIGPEALKCDPETWLVVIRALLADGYITGAQVKTDILGETYVDIEHAAITMKGATFLEENSAFKKFMNIATNIVTIIKP